MDPVTIIGNGYVGSEVALRLGTLGTEVHAYSRRGRWTSPTPPPPSVEVYPLDILKDSPTRLSDAIRPNAHLLLSYAPGMKPQDPRRLYLQGARRIVDACDGKSLKRMVYISSVSACPDLDASVFEDDARRPSGARGNIQREAEEIIINGFTALGVPWIVLRLAGLYGPGRNLSRLYQQRLPSPLDGDGWTATNLVHRADAVSAILASLSLPTAISMRVQVCDDDHRSRREMFEGIAKALGRPVPLWRDSTPTNRPPRGKRVDNQRMKHVLGVNLTFPHHPPQGNLIHGEPTSKL